MFCAAVHLIVIPRLSLLTALLSVIFRGFDLCSLAAVHFDCYSPGFALFLVDLIYVVVQAQSYCCIHWFSIIEVYCFVVLAGVDLCCSAGCAVYLSIRLAVFGVCHWLIIVEDSSFVMGWFHYLR